MAETLTETDQFTATIQMPTAGEEIGAADLRDKAIQRLTDRTRNHKNRIDGNDTDITALETRADALEAADVVMLYFTATSTSHTDIMPVALHLQYPSGGWALSSNQITVPSTGVYMLSVKAPVESASTSNPASAVVHMKVGASGTVAWATGRRFSATASDSMTLVGTGIIGITDTATQYLWFENRTGSTITPSSASGDEKYLNPIVIQRLGDAT